VLNLAEPPSRPGIIVRGPRPRARRTFARDYAALGEEIELAARIEVRNDETLEDLRCSWRTPPELARAYGNEVGSLYYPALAVPLGPADEIVCPEAHVEHVREHQRYAPEGLNLLVIGYSGLDTEVQNLLAWGGRPLSSLKVVNGSFDDSFATVETLSRALKFSPTEDMAFNGGFTEFAQSEALGQFLRAIPTA
jgi:hypothetical protein